MADREPRNPHDALFRHVFTRPEHAAGELQTLLPPALVQAIDWSTLTVVDSALQDAALRGRACDVLYSVHIPGATSTAHVYVVFEHQSKSDRLMPLRMARYVMHVWNRVLGEAPHRATLPLVVPVVLAHDPRGWRAPTRLRELRKLLARPGGTHDLELLLLYTFRVARVSLPRLAQLATTVSPDAEKTVMTLEQMLLRKGRAEGRAQGQAKGRAETLLKLMRLKFGALSADVESAVRAASLERLDLFAERVLTAEHADDVIA